MGSKSNQIFFQDIIQIFYKDDPLQFLKKLGDGKSIALLERRYLQNQSLTRKEIYDNCKDNI